MNEDKIVVQQKDHDAFESVEAAGDKHLDEEHKKKEEVLLQEGEAFCSWCYQKSTFTKVTKVCSSGFSNVSPFCIFPGASQPPYSPYSFLRSGGLDRASHF